MHKFLFTSILIIIGQMAYGNNNDEENKIEFNRRKSAIEINITNNDISITNKLSEPILYITVENEKGEIILTESTYIESNQSQTISLSETESSEYTIYIESEETITNISFTN